MDAELKKLHGNRGRKWEDCFSPEENRERREKHKANYKKNFHSLEARAKAKANMPVVWNKGLTKDKMPLTMYSLERNAKVGRKMAGNTNGFKKEQKPWNYGKIGWRLGSKGYPWSIERRRKIIEKLMGNKCALGHKNSEEMKINMSLIKKAQWQDLERWPRIKNVFRANSFNLSERKLLDVLRKINSEWRYVGGGDLIINGKCPDFWNGNHKLIELFGNYWHEIDDVEKRIEFFASQGYKCLIIWDNELRNLSGLKQKIQQFVGAV